MAKIINQETLMPIGLAILVIGGITAWVSETRSELKNNSEQIKSLSEGNVVHIKLINEINSRLSRIEWALEQKKRN